MADLSGKTALVTGAGRGIGRAIARRLAADGARVIVNYASSAREAGEQVDEIKATGGEAFAAQGDVADLDSIDAMVTQVRGWTDHLDILVNNAGRGSGVGASTLEKLSPEAFDATFALNSRGLFFVTQKILPLLRDGGRIINFSSTSTLARVPGLSAYAGSKAAVEAFTRIWAAELASRKITVNVVLPGMVDTDMIDRGMPAGAKEAAAARHPLGRIGQPQDLADVVAFLASDDSRWINGQTVTVNGGV